MPLSPQLLDHYRSNREAHLEGLKRLLRIPSMSALPAHREDVRKAAEFIAGELRGMGLESVDLIEGAGHPLVYGEWLHAESKPTVLIYGHYDVQPPDPLDEWITPPFEPDIRNDNIYARGAVDDKGQTYLLLKAVEGFFKTHGAPPVNVKFLIEGEEETSGQAIEAYVREHADRLGCDSALICDTDMFAPGLPTLTTGLRGMIYTEIEVIGAKTDLHSGMYGGVAPNPLMGIAEILTALKGPDGRVLIPGFYDDVEEPSQKEKDAWSSLPFDEDAYREAEIGSSQLTGEPGFSAIERTWSRPTLEVHGIRGGFVGDGAKTVIPAKATVKVSMRLVPSQDPGQIAKAYVDRVAEVTPAGLRSQVNVMAKAPASVVSVDHPFVSKAAAALEETFEKETVYIRSGGSIPVAGLFQEHLGVPVVLMGFGLPDDNLHAPNEKFHLPNFYTGIETVGRYLELLGAID